MQKTFVQELQRLRSERDRIENEMHHLNESLKLVYNFSNSRMQMNIPRNISLLVCALFCTRSLFWGAYMVVGE